MCASHADRDRQGSAGRGRLLADRFELGAALGTGGMGVVYQALDRRTGEQVALKAMRGDDADALVRFKNEFRLCADLRHRNLVRLGELIEADDQLFFTMELVVGVDVLSWVRSPAWASAGPDRTPTAPRGLPVARSRRRSTGRVGPAFVEDRLRAAFRQIAAGVGALHAGRRVHRDLKPSNILVTADGRVVILDFGLVVPHVVERPHSDAVAVGTVAYMAPEQAAARPVGPAADWYAVGAMLYEALAGRLPVEGDDPGSLLAAKLHHDAPPVATFAPAAPEDLAALCDELVRRDPQRRPRGPAIRRRLAALEHGDAPVDAAAPAPTPPARTLATPLLGRAAEVATLVASFGVAQRAGRLHVVVAESGLGKTALTRHVVAQLTDAVPGLVVLASRCHERETVRFKAFDGISDQLGKWLVEVPSDDRRSILPDRTGRLGRLFPSLLRVVEIAEAAALAPPDVDVVHARRDAFDSFRELLGRLADAHPVLLVIEDLHRADPDSLDLLGRVMTGVGAPPLLVLATARPSPVVDRLRALADLGDLAPVELLPLGPLAPDAARALARAALIRAAAGDAAGTARLDAITAAAAGHPGFVLELAQATGAGDDGAGDDVAHDAEDLDHLLRRRIARLPLPAQELLYVLVAAEGPLRLDVAAAATEAELAVVLSHLDRLIDGHLAVVTGRGPRDTVEPYHDRVAEVARALLDPWAMQYRHEALALALEATPDADPERILRHWLAAGRDERARQLAAAAAERAVEALRLRRAARLYRLALEGHHPPEERRRLRATLGDVLAVLGDAGGAAAAYREAAGRDGDAIAHDLRRSAAEQLLISGRIADGLALLDDILGEVGMPRPGTPRTAVARLLWSRTRLWWRTLRPPSSPGPVSERARSQLAACWTAAMGLSTVDTIRGADYQARLMRLALDSGDPSAMCRATGLEAGYVATRGVAAGPRVAALLADASALASQTGDPRDQAWVLLGEAAAGYVMGQFRAGRDAAVRARQLITERCIGASWELRTARLCEIWCRYWLGDLARMSELVAGGLAEAASLGDQYTSVQLRMGFGNLTWLIQDDPDAAEAHADDAIRAWNAPTHQMPDNYYLVARTQAALYRGDATAAHDRAVAGVRQVERARLFRIELVAINMLFLRGRAAIAAAAEAHGSVRTRLLAEASRDVELLEHRPAAWGHALAALLRGCTDAVAGRLEAAEIELTRAEAHLDRAGLAVHAAAAQVRRGALRGGAGGRDLVTRGHALLVSMGVRRPDRFVAMLAPGAPA